MVNTFPRTQKSISWGALRHPRHKREKPRVKVSDRRNYEWRCCCVESCAQTEKELKAQGNGKRRLSGPEAHHGHSPVHCAPPQTNNTQKRRIFNIALGQYCQADTKLCIAVDKEYSLSTSSINHRAFFKIPLTILYTLSWRDRAK